MPISISHWIDGAAVEGTSGRTSPVFNPATGEQTGEVQLASTADVERAVASAQEAAVAWRSSSLSRRTEVLFAFRELLHASADELAAIVTAEHGKVLSDAGGEVARGLENVEFSCGIAGLLKGGFSEQAATGVDVYSIRQPLGVVAGITPFNFPVMVPLWMCANAIACGNAFSLKPSEKDPSAALFLARLWQRAGLPDGVFTGAAGRQGGGRRSPRLPRRCRGELRRIHAIARYIYERGTANGKRVQALGGAKNHMVVLPDADIDLAADARCRRLRGRRRAMHGDLRRSGGRRRRRPPRRRHLGPPAQAPDRRRVRPGQRHGSTDLRRAP
jgi:malonate-semialdehyde dehydrogenase (acetylating)/methylmalonate-semialdehyde dehydrogenase